MKAYDHSFAVVTINGVRITGFSDATDSFAFAQPNAKGTITYGSNRGQGVFVASANSRGGQLSLKILQGHEDNKFFNDIMRSQESLIGHTPIVLYYQDIVNGDTITATGGWILNAPSYTRGTGHNESVWVIEFIDSDVKITGE